MTTVIVHHDPASLPAATADILPVQIYGLTGRSRGDIATIGNPIIDKLKRLGVPLSSASIDFLTIALAVTAADTFVERKNAADGWAREIYLKIPLSAPDPWVRVQNKLEKALRFLSGDLWQLEFSDGGYAPPNPYRQRNGYHLTNLIGLDSVSLFSGGLDSAIGVIDLLGAGSKPLLVSHAYKGDKSHQNLISAHLTGRYSRLSVNANPQSCGSPTDISMRTRSLNFLAFAAVGCCAVQAANNRGTVDLFVPENGFISLNVPITSRRIGSLSTRTTHPYFISMIQNIFNEVGIRAEIKNPYQFKTKGEMILECHNRALLELIVSQTVSCSHWKRKNQQCGSCVPCLIRRASLKKGAMLESCTYQNDSLNTVMGDVDKRDDLLSLSRAIAQVKERPAGAWIIDSGPLPHESIDDFKGVFVRGLAEVEEFLQGEGLLDG